MKIGISATGKTLDSEVDLRFGRCRYFIISDTETNEFEAIDNSSATAAGGAGISAAQILSNKGVKVVLTGNCGPNAYQVFSSAGIDVITGVSGKVKDVVEKFKLGTYSISKQANVPDHYGMGSSSGMGMGRGMGRGMGMGMGGGMGRGMGRGMGMGGGFASQSNQPPQTTGADQDIDALKARSMALAKQLDDIQRRIAELDDKKEDK